MADPINLQLQSIDEAVLTPLVRRSLHREKAKILHWQVQPLTGGVEIESSLHRFTGEAKSGDKTLPWSLVLKIIQSPAGSAGDPLAFRYWKREALAYQSGVLNDLPGGITAPECFSTEEKPDSAYWIWMEDVKDEIGDPWPLEQYGIVARCLGRFNGAYLMGRPLPDGPWVTRHWLRAYLDNAAPEVDHMINSMDHPLMQRSLPGITKEFIQQVWNERLEILDILEHFPQTFCHQDAFRLNLFFRHTPDKQPQVVAVDWSYTGLAPVGAELAAFVAASVYLGGVPPGDALRLEQLALDGYLDGLGQVGWQGDPDMVRFCYAATVFWRYFLAAFPGEMVPFFLDEQLHPMVEKSFGMTVGQAADVYAASGGFMKYKYDQASRLKAILKSKA
jgi:hypothetical protein